MQKISDGIWIHEHFISLSLLNAYQFQEMGNRIVMKQFEEYTELLKKINEEVEDENVSQLSIFTNNISHFVINHPIFSCLKRLWTNISLSRAKSNVSRRLWLSMPINWEETENSNSL